MKVSQANWIALGSSVLLLAAVFFIISREHSFDALLQVWNRTDTGAFFVAIFLMIACQTTAAWRIAFIMWTEGLSSVGFLSVFRIQLISQFVAHGAPISALSDFAKAAMIKLRFGLSSGRSVRIVFYERILAALGTVAVGLIAAIIQFVVPTSSDLLRAQLLLWGAGCAGIAVLLIIGGLHVRTGIDLLDRSIRAILDLGIFLRRPAAALQLILISFAQIIGLATVFMVLGYGMHIQVSRIHIILFMPLIFFVSSLPIFYQGWGGREAAVVATIGSLANVTTAEAIALSVAFGVVVFLASLPGATFWMMRPSMRKAVRMEAEHT